MFFYFCFVIYVITTYHILIHTHCNTSMMFEWCISSSRRAEMILHQLIKPACIINEYHVFQNKYFINRHWFPSVLNFSFYLDKIPHLWLTFWPHYYRGKYVNRDTKIGMGVIPIKCCKTIKLALSCLLTNSWYEIVIWILNKNFYHA